MEQYVIGVDFGSLSARAVAVRVSDGAEMGSAAMDYPHAVMTQSLPTGERLGVDWALQHPRDYLECLTFAVRGAMESAKLSPDDVIGIATDFTSCTGLPVLADGTPLCFLPEFEHEPHAYVKLWKHHAAQTLADRMTDTAHARGEAWIGDYGGRISSEWALPKLWQILEEAPQIYDRMAHWVDAVDWIVWQLTGVPMLSECAAGYKALYRKGVGYPDKAYFAALDLRLENVVVEKLSLPLQPLGSKAGELTAPMAERLGLRPGTAVAVGNVDAHVCVPAVGMLEPGKVLAIIGTSTCHMVLGKEAKPVPGICGVVEDGILPGLMGYEAGQCCVGDHFAWLADKLCPAAYQAEAQARGMSIHSLLTEKAAKLSPGQSGLIALDWWNGNRSVLSDGRLTGMMLGMTLETTCEEIYRALMEATAYGARTIVENYRAHGVPVEEFIASGGISQKNPFMMQLYADVLNMPVSVTGSTQGPALGSAIFAAVAAGVHPDVYAAARAMAGKPVAQYLPREKEARVYDALYREYAELHDYFGRGGNDVMKRLKGMKA